MNSLLASCLTYQRQLTDEDRADFVRALEVAIRRGRHMNRFMQGFADVVRLPPPDKTPCDLASLVDQVEQLLKEELGERRVNWVWGERGDVGSITADPAQMEQVLLHVARNALEAIGHDGTITVRLGRRGRQPFLAVRDTGSGVSPEVQPQLFTPFFTTKDDGQGIGLTLVQEIVLAHGFELSLLDVGNGAELTILF